MHVLYIHNILYNIDPKRRGVALSLAGSLCQQCGAEWTLLVCSELVVKIFL